ncbi:hypothetical protein GECvBMG_gp263 [Salmonella phage GEC_vB_MG]|uniref:Uncharacterized protein 226 n=2 Tax=Seunavirus TaxID=1914851 RepID=G3BM92_9CAUD|nr:hypothetical protein PVP-SE1_gp226 [Salmonella phage PVPSE1]YP_009148899.1 hypothetical protein ACQ19_gp103 [Salmonella phage SSE121]ADP02622.1 conserved hypothetical protein [Salmonella phage PVPSE1]AFU63744.1 hypothetical protein [Salmonella phage SSE121]QPI14807.1 hypothetical protein GECvBMG_gp263 [Salmonella phage GEC_vB_MG]
MTKLNWKEAQQAMREGKKVRNQYFTPEEFFEMKNGQIVCEMGYNMAGWYLGEAWQDEGWSVIDA